MGGYRVEELPEGFEPQMRYVMNGKLDWTPLREDGCWAEPGSYSHGRSPRRYPLESLGQAERAILRARKINGEQVLAALNPGE